MIIAYCPDCDGEVDLKPNVQVGQKIRCPHCRVKLEVIRLDPPALDWVYEGKAVKLDLFDDTTPGKNPD